MHTNLTLHMLDLQYARTIGHKTSYFHNYYNTLTVIEVMKELMQALWMKRSLFSINCLGIDKTSSRSRHPAEGLRRRDFQPSEVLAAAIAFVCSHTT